MELKAVQVAEFYGVTTKTVQNWITQGMPVKQKGSKGVASVFESVDVHNWLLERAVQKRITTTSSDEVFDKQAQEARLKHHQANIEEMKEAQLRGELIPVVEAIEAFGDLAANARAKFLRLSDLVPECYQDTLNTGIRTALDELSQPAAGLS